MSRALLISLLSTLTCLTGCFDGEQGVDVSWGDIMGLEEHTEAVSDDK